MNGLALLTLTLSLSKGEGGRAFFDSLLDQIMVQAYSAASGCLACWSKKEAVVGSCGTAMS